MQIVRVYPVENSNIANHTKIRKGNIDQGWQESEVTIEADFSIPQTDHAAMEPRCSMAEILPDGQVIIYSASQSTFIIKKLLAQFFGLSLGKITVHTPLVGGAFGGRAVQLEFLFWLPEP